MNIPPREVFDQAARVRLLARLLDARGIAPSSFDPATFQATAAIGATLAHHGSAVVDAAMAMANADVLRFAAGTFDLWSITCDQLAEYIDAVIAGNAAEGAAAIEEFVRDIGRPR